MNKRILVCGVIAAAACKNNDPKADPPAPPPTEAPKMVEPAKPKAPEGPDPKLVERGAYIAKTSGCAVCHTGMGPTGPDLEHVFAGGLEMPDPLGTWRTPNITPDKASGIGSWTDDQIARAIREGVRPDGSQLFVIMPYQNYNRMTDDDVHALVAFLKTVKPVERVVAPNKDLRFPKVPVGKPANAPDDIANPAAHGEYMSTLMLCNHCHWTPDKKMAPAADKMFSGGLDMTIPMLGTGKLYSPNISSDKDTGIGKWTEDQIFTTIKTMTRPDGKMIRGPMLFLQSGWSQLDDKDLKAVATYIHALPAVKNKVPVSTFVSNPPGSPPGAPGPAAPETKPAEPVSPAKKG